MTGSPYVVKIDEQGDTLWTKRYKAGTGGMNIKLRQLYDSNYVAFGLTENFNACSEPYDMFLMKLKANGDTVWTKHYGTCYPDYPQELVKAPNNGYYLLGNIDVGAYSYGSSLLRLNEQGDTVWTRLINVTGYGQNQNYSCTATDDGGLIMMGIVYDTAVPSSSYLIKIDSSGFIQWDIYIDGIYVNGAYQLITTANGYFVIGACNLGGTLGYGTMLMKTDFNGTPLWGKMYDSIGIYLRSGLLLDNSSIFLSGFKQRGPVIAGQNNTDLVSVKTDSSGNLLWAKKYVTNQLGFGAYSSITPLQANDGGVLIATTSTTDPAYLTYNGFLAKIDSLGNSCSDSTLAINVVDITSMIVISDTINPVVGYYPVTVGRSPFSYGSGINYIDLCNGYVGVEENEIEDDVLLKVFPNPANEQATVLVNLAEDESKAVIEMYDITGRKLETFAVKGDGVLTVNTTKYAKGLYVFLLYINDQPVDNVKLAIVK